MSFKYIVLKDIFLLNNIKTFPIEIENYIFSFLSQDDIKNFKKRIKLRKNISNQINSSISINSTCKQEPNYPSCFVEYKRKIKRKKVYKKKDKKQNYKFYKFLSFNVENEDENYFLNQDNFNNLWYGYTTFYIDWTTEFYNSFFIEINTYISVNNRKFFFIYSIEHKYRDTDKVFYLKQKVIPLDTSSKLKELIFEYYNTPSNWGKERMFLRMLHYFNHYRKLI